MLFDVVSFYCEVFIHHSESLLQQTLLQAVTAGIASARAQYRAANYSWKLAGWQLLRTQERQKLGVVAGVARCLSQYVAISQTFLLTLVDFRFFNAEPS